MRGKEKLTAVLTGALMVGYIGFLLAANYRSQMHLSDSNLKELKQATEKYSLTVSYFYEECKNDLKNLAGNMALDAFFENKALGMSMEYGLSSSLMAVSEQFQRLVDEKKAGGGRIYSRIRFIDRDGQMLVDSEGSTLDPQHETIPESFATSLDRDVTIIAQADTAKRLRVILTVSYFFKDTYAGQVIAWIEPGAISRYFDKPDDLENQKLLLIGAAGYLPLSVGPKWNESGYLFNKLRAIQNNKPLRFRLADNRENRIEMIAVGAPVQGTPFLVVNAVPSVELFGTASPYQLLLAMGLIALIVFGGASFVWHTNTRNKILKTRIAESTKRENEIAEKNLALSREILERMRTEKALQESEKKYRELVENLSDIIFTTNQKGHISYINPSVESILGYAPQEVIGLPVGSIIVPEDLPEARQLYRHVFSGKPVKRELRFLTKSKNVRWIQVSSHPVFAEDTVSGIRGIATDITQTRLLQDQLIRSERLAATGQLAASIAHEINSPLQGITALLGVIKTTHSRDKELQKNIDLIKCAMGGIRDTVRNLLDLNRPGKEKQQPTDVNKVIEDTMRLIRGHLKKSGVTLRLNLSTSVPVITASPQQLGQVFMNLINNAVEAISGTLYGKSRKTNLSGHGQVTITTCLKRSQVVIEVADTGPGISDTDLEHIFDPFYTKKKTMGMGVGLSICHGIIEDHKGSIQARNSNEGGAVFTIILPADSMSS